MPHIVQGNDIQPPPETRSVFKRLKGFFSAQKTCPTDINHKTMGLNRFSLAFKDPDLESRFRDIYTIKALHHVRISLSLGIFIYAAFGVLDAYLAPTVKTELWTIRYMVVCPVFIVAMALFSTSRLKNFMQPVLFLVMIIAGSGIIAMVVYSPAPANYSYYTGLILIFMFGYSFVRLRFVWASIGGWILVILYEAAAIIFTDTPMLILLNNNFFFISANVIGMFSCYFIEYYARRDFFWTLLLKEEERKVRTANRNLEDQVLDRTRQLLEANQELKAEIEAHQQSEQEKLKLQHQLQHAQKMEAIGTLAGGIAHDFNNILAAIVGYTELGLLRLPAADPCTTYLDQSLKACQRAKELIRQILTFSRRQQQEEHSPIDIKPVITEVLGLLRASLPKNILIRHNIDPDIHAVAVGATHIHQMLMNLCMNAFHAMEKMGGELFVNVCNFYLSEEAIDGFDEISEGEYVKISVRDTGTGIDPSIRDRIFDPYFSTKEHGKGSGMGLALTHGIVKSYKGAIRFESWPGDGTLFEIFLPKCKGIMSQRQDLPESMPKGNESIFFVDDEEYLTQLVHEMLSRLGYRIQVCKNPVEALEILRSDPNQFHLVITDMVMPNLSGVDLARQLRAIRQDLPIILCSGLNDPYEPEQEDEAAIVAFLLKPFSFEELAKTVRRALDGHKAIIEIQNESKSPSI
mgnify:CR=1 FL=1